MKTKSLNLAHFSGLQFLHIKYEEIGKKFLIIYLTQAFHEPMANLKTVMTIVLIKSLISSSSALKDMQIFNWCFCLLTLGHEMFEQGKGVSFVISCSFKLQRE